MAPVESRSRVWYREPWPWLLMAGPAAVVVAGICTAILAVRSDDGLVAEDYYRRGLAINQVLRREDRARRLGLAAVVSFSGARVRVVLSGAGIAPEAVRLRLIHPTRAGLDQTLSLPRIAPGIYAGSVATIGSEPRRLVLEDQAASWRLSGNAPGGAARVSLDTR